MRCKMWEWMDEEKYTHDCDIVSVAGASKGITDGGVAQEMLFKQIDVAYNLHEVRHVILLHHSDCGAYANSYQFSDPVEEKEKQLEDMEKAKQIVEDRYVGVDVILVWGELKDENGEEIEFSRL